VIDFFAALRVAGDEYSNLRSAGDPAKANALLDRIRAEVIAPFTGPGTGGNIAMTSSQISTTAGGDLFVVATGAVNVGTTVIRSSSGSEEKNTGIYTGLGGGVNVFAKGDVNVNEARLMTFLGGDITVWSDAGDINAGKGSKTVVSMGKPTYSCDSSGTCTVTIRIPTVGSGIRALSYDKNIPVGDLHLYAPGGTIDAGEAGMSGGRVVLGAQTVLNVGNISFSAGSVGVPSASHAVALGALTGSTGLGEKSAVSREVGTMGAAKGGGSQEAARQAIEDMVMKYLDVRVIGFDFSSGVVGGPPVEGER
jgi:hypothetical protein